MAARRAAFAIASLAAAAAACSLVDLSGLTSDAAPADAAADTSAPGFDGSVVTDSSASDATDATPLGFCAAAGPHTLCEDFDTTADAGWTSFPSFGGGTGKRDLVDFASPPASFALTTPATAADGGEAWQFVILRLPIVTTHVHLEAKVQACSSAGEYVFLSVNSLTASDAYGAIDVGVQRTAGGTETYLTVKHDAYSKTFRLGAALPSTRFSRLVLDTDLDKVNGSVKLSIDGTTVVDATNLPTDQSATVTRRAAWPGLYAYEAPACAARIDDVIIDAQ